MSQTPTESELLNYLRGHGRLRTEGGGGGARQARMDCPQCSGKKTFLVALGGEAIGAHYCHHAGCSARGGLRTLGDLFGGASPWGKREVEEPEESRRIRDQLARMSRQKVQAKALDRAPPEAPEPAETPSKPEPQPEPKKPVTDSPAPRRGNPFAFEADLHERCAEDLWTQEWAAPVLAYLREGRGFSDDAIKEFSLGALRAPMSSGKGSYLFLAYPILDNREKLVNIKFRPIPGVCPVCQGKGCPKPKKGRPMCDRGKIAKQFFRCPGRPTTLAGVERLPDGEYGRIVVVEGELDIVAAWDLGTRWGVVSGTAGAGTWREEWTALLEPFASIVLAGDQDKRGDEGATKVAEAMGRSRCSRARYPAKDANDLLKGGDITAQREAWREALDNAESMMELRLVKVGYYQEYFEEMQRDPEAMRGIPSGWDDLDRCIAGWPSGLTVVTGDTGEGKTTFASFCGYRLARRGIPVVVTAFEQRAALIQKLMRQDMQGDFTRRSERERKECFDRLDRMPLFLTNQTGEVDASKVVAAIRYAARVEGVRWFLIDHLGYLLGGVKQEQEKHLIDTLVRALAGLGAELNIAIVLIAHPNRGNVSGHFKQRVTHKNLKGSSAIEQEAALILVVERGNIASKKKGAEQRPHALIHIDKVRTEFGLPGSRVKMYFDPRACRYETDYNLLPIAQVNPGL